MPDRFFFKLTETNSDIGSRIKMTYIITISAILLILCCQSACGTVPQSSSSSYERDNSICQRLVESKGYTCESHKVTTKDGYILGLQRIPGGLGGTHGVKSPVLLQHGLLTVQDFVSGFTLGFQDGASWVMSSPDKSLAFILADHGYDVWIANTRGTKSSRGHTSLEPRNKAFWDWSLDELATYDLADALHYVHDQTGHNLHFVGHSMGAMIALAALSKDQSLSKLRSAALLCPISYMDQTSPIAKAGADIISTNVPYWLSVAKMNPIGPATIKLELDICKTPGVDCQEDMYTALVGPNCCTDPHKVLAMLSHAAPTATKNLVHLAQNLKEGTIAMYDYNSEDENKNRYGKTTPPVYKMSNIPKEFPLFVGYGGLDKLSDPRDVQGLLDRLKDHDKDKLTVKYIEDYGHVDFVFGANAKRMIYEPLIDFFESH